MVAAAAEAVAAAAAIIIINRTFPTVLADFTGKQEIWRKGKEHREGKGEGEGKWKDLANEER